METRFRISVWILATLAVPSAGLFADPVIGASREAVITEMGAPRSRMSVSNRELLTYERGTVSLEDGLVVKTNLISSEEWERREHRRAAEIRAKVEAEAKEDARVEQLRKEGDAALSKLVTSAEWRDAGGIERVAMLDRFSTSYPYARTGAVRPAAELRRDREVAEAAKNRELENRLVEAESRANDAENRAKLAENNAAVAVAAAESARQSAEAAAARARETPSGYISAYTVIGGRGYYDYNYYNRPRNPTVVVGNGGTLVTNGPVTVIRPGERPAVRPTPRPVAPIPNNVTPAPGANRATPAPGANRATPPSAQKR